MASNNSRPVTDSAEFPPGYGDFVMQSNDNVLFSFPRGVLAHVSPLFKDMFSIGSNATVSNSQSGEPLVMAEDATSIELMLRYIDPLKDSPQMRTSTLPGLVKAAHKYQIDFIISAFERKVNVTPRSKVIIPDYADDPDELITKNPLLVLSLAIQTGLDELASCALKNALEGDANILKTNDVELNADLLREIHTTRRQREDQHLDHIMTIQKDFQSDDRAQCIHCHDQFMTWCFTTIFNIRRRPVFTTINQCSLPLQVACQHTRVVAASSLRKLAPWEERWPDILSRWEESAGEWEAGLPSLP